MLSVITLNTTYPNFILFVLLGKTNDFNLIYLFYDWAISLAPSVFLP